MHWHWAIEKDSATDGDATHQEENLPLHYSNQNVWWPFTSNYLYCFYISRQETWTYEWITLTTWTILESANDHAWSKKPFECNTNPDLQGTCLLPQSLLRPSGLHAGWHQNSRTFGKLQRLLSVIIIIIIIIIITIIITIIIISTIIILIIIIRTAGEWNAVGWGVNCLLTPGTTQSWLAEVEELTDTGHQHQKLSSDQVGGNQSHLSPTSWANQPSLNHFTFAQAFIKVTSPPGKFSGGFPLG